METHAKIREAIDHFKERAVAISHDIHEHPELRFKEHYCSGLLAKSLRELGLQVETGVFGLETAFRASFGNDGPVIAVMAEYDALPNGHSCGHNLISGAALSAIAGLKAVADELPGTVVILGTPAEEGGGGKIVMIEHGALKGIEAAMMAHPAAAETSAAAALATSHLRLSFTGKAAHAAASPWDGASALSALIQTFVTVDQARVHFRDGSRVHGYITNGGQAVNIIPEHTECEFLARAHQSAYAQQLARRIIRCAEAAALATGTGLKHEVIGGYKNMINNLTMAERYRIHTKELGVEAPFAPPGAAAGSTDMGDVSHVVPAIHPIFQVAERHEGNCHEDAFVGHADSPRGYDAMIRVAKALAQTAYDLMAEPELLKAAKEEFARRETSQRQSGAEF